MQKSYYYEAGTCHKDGYNGLYPIVYLQEQEKQPYHKQKMGCQKVLSGDCQKEITCPVFQSAPDRIYEADFWKLRATKIGEEQIAKKEAQIASSFLLVQIHAHANDYS